MLTIKTDLDNTFWLKYIVEEFRNINIADFEIEIMSLDDHSSNNNIIYYVQNPAGKISIYNSNQIIPSNKIEYLRKDLFILEKSWSDNFSVNYDIFWNAFVFLSRCEEYISEKYGKNIYSYSLNHPRLDKNSFDIPIVNILFNDLEIFIKDNFNDLRFKEKQEPQIELSHDVDYINKTIQLRLKQTAFNGFNTIKSLFKPKQFLRDLSKTVNFAFSNPSYWCFDYWQDLESSHSRKSTYYVYVKNGKKNLKSWLIDPSYDIRTNIKLQLKLKELYNKGFEIGLHGSYYSANSVDRLKQEKDILEETLNIKVTKTRQHWLNYFEERTPYIHNRLFETDSTLAWNDRIGFRSGCVSKYRPYDFKNKRAFNYEIIPQVIMDSNIYDYSVRDSELLKSKNMIRMSKEISKTTYISISWHQRVCSSDYKWHDFYEELLNEYI